MTATKIPQSDASQLAAAIARWVDEGGRSHSVPGDAAAQKSKKDPRSGRRIRNKQKEASNAAHRADSR
jgi:hypothetical protein